MTISHNTLMYVRFKAAVIFLLLTASFTTLSAQDGGTGAAATEGNLSLWSLIQQGGWAMYPLGLCSVAMFFLIFYSWKETRRDRFFTREQIETTTRSLQTGDLETARSMLEATPALLARALGPALLKIRHARKKADDLFVENLEAEENAVSQWITYLNVVAAVAPMIGLLGTVSGMISAFQTIGRGGMGRPELLAGDIGEALITTATGLTIGIPAMVAYFVMRNRLNSAMIATAQAGTDLIEIAEAPESPEEAASADPVSSL
ncbi:MAG: MotA/TolQ/ExbB proton channel family protein [Opitutales bacterium]